MNRGLTLNAAQTVFRTADQLGATVPKTAADDFEHLLAVIDRAHMLKAELRHDIGARAFAALEAGKDPFDDPAVHQAAARCVLTDHFGGVEQALDARAQQFMEDHAVALLGCFAVPFDQAADKITAALELLGDIDLTDTKAIARKGPEAAAAWAEVQQAEQTITRILQMWKTLRGVSHAVPFDKRNAALIVADIPPADWLAQTTTTAELGAWDLARKGWPLSFATPDTYRERLAAIAAESTRRQANREQAATDAYRQMHGSGTRTVA
jgi:hypothetical protein